MMKKAEIRTFEQLKNLIERNVPVDWMSEIFPSYKYLHKKTTIGFFKSLNKIKTPEKDSSSVNLFIKIFVAKLNKFVHYRDEQQQGFLNFINKNKYLFFVYATLRFPNFGIFRNYDWLDIGEINFNKFEKELCSNLQERLFVCEDEITSFCQNRLKNWLYSKINNGLYEILISENCLFTNPALYILSGNHGNKFIEKSEELNDFDSIKIIIDHNSRRYF